MGEEKRKRGKEWEEDGEGTRVIQTYTDELSDNKLNRSVRPSLLDS